MNTHRTESLTHSLQTNIAQPMEQSMTSSPCLAPTFALSQAELFDFLAISSQEALAYMMTDNIDGYYVGSTYQSSSTNKYHHKKNGYLGDYSATIAEHRCDKSQALTARFLPYGVEHHYAFGSDCFSLIQGKRLACITLNAKQPALMTLKPELNLPLNQCIVHLSDTAWVYEIPAAYRTEGAPCYLAISASQSVTLCENHSPARLTITTNAKTTTLHIYFSFTHTLEDAVEQAATAVQQQAFEQNKRTIYQFLTQNMLWCNHHEYNKALMWARFSGHSMINQEFGYSGIWAGLPWFKDGWGRDTFIALPGICLVNGDFATAKSIIEDFARLQETRPDSVHYGRIPNRVSSDSQIIYNTTDGTPWMIRELLEYLNYSGDTAFASKLYPVLKHFISGVERHYLADDGCMLHRDPDTWMDAKIEGQIPWSPRGPKANDIQALWYESLQVGVTLAQLLGDATSADHWQCMAQKVKQSFTEKFWDSSKLRLADRLDHTDHPDWTIRPNQLMTITIPQQQPLFTEEYAAAILIQATENLLFPWGICSLNQHHPEFHPYHDNRSEYHKDAAYHNGTIWGWNAGFTISALTRFNQTELAYQLTKQLTHQVLHQGHRGTMSENLDAYQISTEKLVESGTYSQAWSVSEFARNAQQDYLGYRPQMLQQTLTLAPRFPNEWNEVSARVPFGSSHHLDIIWHRQGIDQHIEIIPSQSFPELKLHLNLLVTDNQHWHIETNLGGKMSIRYSKQQYDSHPKMQAALVTMPSWIPYPLTFCQPDWTLTHSALQEQNFLLNKRRRENLSTAHD